MQLTSVSVLSDAAPLHSCSSPLQLRLISVLLDGRAAARQNLLHLLVHKCVGFPGGWGGADGRGTYSSSLSNFKQML